MDKSIRFVSSLSHQERIEAEMLHAILLDEAIYPWNPADLVTTTHCDSLTANFEASISYESVASHWSNLSRQAEQLWIAY